MVIIRRWKPIRSIQHINSPFHSTESRHLDVYHLNLATPIWLEIPYQYAEPSIRTWWMGITWSGPMHKRYFMKDNCGRKMIVTLPLMGRKAMTTFVMLSSGNFSPLTSRPKSQEGYLKQAVINLIFASIYYSSSNVNGPASIGHLGYNIPCHLMGHISILKCSI